MGLFGAKRAMTRSFFFETVYVAYTMQFRYNFFVAFHMYLTTSSAFCQGVSQKSLDIESSDEFSSGIVPGFLLFALITEE